MYVPKTTTRKLICAFRVQSRKVLKYWLSFSYVRQLEVNPLRSLKR